MSQNVLILGATSGIARAVVRRLARDGDCLLLAGRNEEELKRIANDVHVRAECRADTICFDALATDEHAAFVEQCIAHFDDQLDGVILCHGTMFDQAEAQNDFALAQQMIQTNYTSAVSILEPVATYMQARKQGYICGISSVAGDRGRQSNYIYGSTKAALTTYLAGLRHRMANENVQVITIKPGIVDTPMTFGVVDRNSPLVATPDRIAQDVVRAIRRGSPTIYTPWFWRCIMTIIRAVPERLFWRTKL